MTGKKYKPKKIKGATSLPSPMRERRHSDTRQNETDITDIIRREIDTYLRQTVQREIRFLMDAYITNNFMNNAMTTLAKNTVNNITHTRNRTGIEEILVKTASALFRQLV